MLWARRGTAAAALDDREGPARGARISRHWRTAAGLEAQCRGTGSDAADPPGADLLCSAGQAGMQIQPWLRFPGSLAAGRAVRSRELCVGLITAVSDDATKLPQPLAFRAG